MNLIKIIVLSHASSASTDWDRVERTLGYDLAFLSMPRQYERIRSFCDDTFPLTE